MANHHRAAATLLLILSFLVAVALSGADARPTVHPNKEAAALRGSNVGGLTDVRHDAIGRGYVAVAAAPSAVPDPELTGSKCEDGNDEEEDPEDKPNQNPKKDPEDKPPMDQGAEAPHTPQTVLETESEEPKQPEPELCSTCEPEPKPEPPCNTCEQEPKPELPCNTCEPEPEMTCNKVHAVQEGETCDSVGQCAGLGQDDFLRFNPNLCCDHLFVGQWVCLEATCAA